MRYIVFGYIGSIKAVPLDSVLQIRVQNLKKNQFSAKIYVEGTKKPISMRWLFLAPKHMFRSDG